MNVAPGAKKGLISLIVLANDGCTFRGDKEQLVVWNRHGKEIIHASRDVEDEGSMWKIALLELKGSSVSGVASQELKESAESDVESNMINLKENNDVYVNADMLQRAREVRELHERLGHPSNDVMKVMLDHSTSPTFG